MKKKKMVKPKDIDKSKGRTHKQLEKMRKKRSTIGMTGRCVECNELFDTTKNKKKYPDEWWSGCICGEKCYKKFHRKIKKELKEKYGDYETPFPADFYKKFARRLKPRKKKRELKPRTKK